jgi:hypothetical protein
MATRVPQPPTVPAGRAQAEAAFLEANPSYRETAVLDELRASEYGRLDASGDVYLDYTGGSLYAESQLDEHLRLLRETVFGNPHSVNPTSSAATVLVERARATSTRPRASTPASSPRTPRARCASSGRRIRSGRRAISWRRSTTTTRSTASASSPGRRELGRRTYRSRRPIFALPPGCSSVTSTRPRTAPISSPTQRSPTSLA